MNRIHSCEVCFRKVKVSRTYHNDFKHSFSIRLCEECYQNPLYLRIILYHRFTHFRKKKVAFVDFQ